MTFPLFLFLLFGLEGVPRSGRLGPEVVVLFDLRLGTRIVVQLLKVKMC
jgi:hypothetical protein